MEGGPARVFSGDLPLSRRALYGLSYGAKGGSEPSRVGSSAPTYSPARLPSCYGPCATWCWSPFSLGQVFEPRRYSAGVHRLSDDEPGMTAATYPTVFLETVERHAYGLVVDFCAVSGLDIVLDRRGL